MVWLYNSSGVYSSQSLYKIINFRGIKTVHVSALWHIKIPPRVHFFLWQLINNKVLTRDNLAKWRKVKDPSCLLCLEQESVHHLFFECVVAKQCWKVISDAVGTIVGIDLAVIGQFWLSEKRHGILNIVTSAVFWSIWKLRNEILFQNIGWRSMDILLYRMAGLLQNWAILCPPEKKDLMKIIVKKIWAAAKTTLCFPEAGVWRSQEVIWTRWLFKLTLITRCMGNRFPLRIEAWWLRWKSLSECSFSYCWRSMCVPLCICFISITL